MTVFDMLIYSPDFECFCTLKYHSSFLFPSQGNSSLEITQHPENRVVATGAEATFRVKAGGDNLTFQWQKDGNDLFDDSRHQGTSTDTLHVQNVKKDDRGSYRCLLDNNIDRKFSRGAQLSTRKQIFIGSICSECVPHHAV